MRENQGVASVDAKFNELENTINASDVCDVVKEVLKYHVGMVMATEFVNLTAFVNEVVKECKGLSEQEAFLKVASMAAA